jgi:hypothetical protein
VLVLPGQGAQNLDEKMEVKKRNKYGCEASQGTARDAGVLVTPTTRRAGVASFVPSPIATNTQQAIASKHERPIASQIRRMYTTFRPSKFVDFASLV